MNLFYVSDEDSTEVVAGPSSSGHTVAGEEEESVFSKLEKTRTTLETKFGLASLLEAYELIQVNFFCTECHIICLTTLLYIIIIAVKASALAMAL